MKVDIEKEIDNATIKLLEMVKSDCCNNVSNNVLFILSNINEIIGVNSFERRVSRKKNNERKEPKKLSEISCEINGFYETIYDINLVVYKSKKKATVIEIQYYLKKDLDAEYLKTVINNSPMLHCKIAIPPYLQSKKEKYDVNWELGGIKYHWNMFWWKRKMVKQLKLRN